MSAEYLRSTAALMRERAENARSGRWFNEDNEVRADWTLVREVAVCEGSIPQGNRANAQHIAAWHPAVALAVADWLDDEAFMNEQGRVMAAAALDVAMTWRGAA